jgi:exopolysaccharide production protein ExoQ
MHGRLAVTPTARPARLSMSEALRWLAPFVAVAAVAYPTLIWPLTESVAVADGPMLAPPSLPGPPSMLLRTYIPALMLMGVAVFLGRASWLANAAGHLAGTGHPAGTGLFHPALLFCGLFLAYAAISHTWAVDPDLSLRRCMLVSFIITAVVGSALATDDWRRLVNILFWWFSLVVAMNAYAVLTRPPTSLGHAGIYPHKNYLGAVSAMIVLTSVHVLFIGRTFARFAAAGMFAAAMFFLIASKSKTSLALSLLAPALAFGFAVLARYARLSPALTVPLLFGGVYFVYAFGAASGFWDFEAMATAVFGDPTLTQRTEIWAFAFHMMPDHLTFGFGYEGFWGAGSESPSFRAGGPGFVAQMPHAHNGYIDLVLQTGFVGLVIFAFMMLAALHVAGRVARSSLALSSFTLSYMIFCMLYNLFETTFFRSFNVKHMMLMTVIGLAVAHEARVKSLRGRR